MSDPLEEGELSFAVDARHIRQLGRELVGDRITAVSELIKNAYDADATHVVVSFSPVSAGAPGGRVEIADDGSGMTLMDVKQKWMVISTDSKFEESISREFRRQRAGQKGIGRFSVESLGERLTMSTSVIGSDHRLVVEFDWAQYEAGVRLENVTNAFHYEPCPSEVHGTTLRVSGLHERWTVQDLARVRNAVFLLQPPFATASVHGTETEDPGFKVTVRYGDGDAVLEDEPDSPGNVDDVYAAATAWLTAEIDSDGIARAMVTSEHLGIQESRVFPSPLLTTGPCRFRAAYFIFRRDALNPDSSVGVQRARKLADLFGGIRVYRDGLRVMPYGEPRNDWLGLDALYRQRGAVLAPIGAANFFGELLLTREDNVLIVDTASREGVVENDAFRELRKFLRDSIVWAVNLVASVRRKKVKAGTRPEDDEEEEEPESRADLVAPICDALNAVDAASTDEQRETAMAGLSHAVRDAQAEAAASDSRERAEKEQLIDEITLLRVLASVGGSVAVFSHEVRAVLGQAEAAIGDLVDLAPPGATTALESAERGLHSLGDLASYLDVYLSQTGRRRREEIPVGVVIETFVKQVTPLLSRRGIEVDFLADPPHLRTQKMARSELEAVLFNLLSNSVRALDREGPDGKKIRVTASEEAGDITLSFLDTGPGIPRSDWTRVFDAFYTTSSADDAELGFGTGLGLTIVADIASTNGGSAAVVEAAFPFSTCIEVRLPSSTSPSKG